MVINDFHGEYFFLSNFSESPLYYNGKLWPTVEHAFQAAKVDEDTANKILVAPTPGAAKRLGRTGTLIFKDWDVRRYNVMKQCLLRKFLTDEALLNKLMATGDAELIEGNTWHDNAWGDCSCEKCKNKPGANMLGKLLMEIREKARNHQYVFAVETADSDHNSSIKGHFKTYADAAKDVVTRKDWGYDEYCVPDDRHILIIELE
jgi:ribA/ribD-fused uncharacterized protein